MGNILWCEEKKCEKCIKNDEIIILEDEIKQLNLMLELKDTKINLLEKQIYILEKYKND
jgi:hypothetical protein